MTKEQLLFILDQVESLPLTLYVDYSPEDGMLELIPPSNPIHILGLRDLKCRGIYLAPLCSPQFGSIISVGIRRLGFVL
jgi:hypothetical protein